MELLMRVAILGLGTLAHGVLSKTTRLNFHEFSVHRDCSGGSVILFLPLLKIGEGPQNQDVRCDSLCTHMQHLPQQFPDLRWPVSENYMYLS